MSNNQNKFYITTPIYYVNDKPHVGTAYTTVAADVLARWHRQQGAEVFFLVGTDENSQKNVEAAKKAGKDIQAYVDELAGVFRETWLKLGISFDRFIRTTSAEHKKAVYDFFKRVNERGDIYQGDYEGYYCVDCEEFKKETDLVDGFCGEHKEKPEWIVEKNYFFRASNYKQALLDHIEQNPNFVQPITRRNEIVNFIRDHLDDFSITRQSVEWGIPLPLDESQIIYVWFDALLNYLSGIGFGQDQTKFEKYWPADLQLVGKDIIKFHCAYWPAMLLSAGLPLPKAIYAHGFFTIKGEKISKLLGNVIDPLELAKEYPFDAVRYFMLREIKFGADGDFSLERLQQRYNSDLANDLGNLVQRTLQMISQYLSGKVDRAAKHGAPVDFAQIGNLTQELRFDEALKVIWQGITWANKYIEEQKPWELSKAGDSNKLSGVLARLYAILRDIAKELVPYLPQTAGRIQELLEADTIGPPAEPLFPRRA